MILDGLIEVADDIIADVAVHRDARQRDIDFLQRAITDLAMRLRLDDAPRDVRIADAARAREEMAAGMVEAVISLGQFMHNFLLHARTVIHRDDMEGIAIDMSVKLIKVAAVKQPQHFLIGIEQLIRLLRLRDVETTRQVLYHSWEVAQVFHFLFHYAFLSRKIILFLLAGFVVQGKRPILDVLSCAQLHPVGRGWRLHQQESHSCRRLHELFFLRLLYKYTPEKRRCCFQL